MDCKKWICRLMPFVWGLVAIAVLVIGISSVCGAAWAKGEVQADNPFADAVQAGVDDGIYLIDVSMEGGTGRATVVSPAKLEVKDGLGAVTLEWSSPNYDYMVVAGKQYVPVNTEGNSVFVIPVVGYDEPVMMVGDTTAMSEPHEIEYLFTFDSSSIQKESIVTVGGEYVSFPALVIALIAVVCVIAGLLVAWRRRFHS